MHDAAQEVNACLHTTHRLLLHLAEVGAQFAEVHSPVQFKDQHGHCAQSIAEIVEEACLLLVPGDALVPLGSRLELNEYWIHDLSGDAKERQYVECELLPLFVHACLVRHKAVVQN